MDYRIIHDNGIGMPEKLLGVPEYTNSNRPSLPSGLVGFKIYNTTTKCYNTWNGVCWMLDNGLPDYTYCLPVTNFTIGKYITTNQGVGNVCPMSYTTASGNVCVILEPAQGTIIRIEGVGGNGNRTWCFVDKTDSTILSVAPAITSTQANAPIIYLSAPANAYLVINLRDKNATPDYNNNKGTPYCVFMFSNTTFNDANQISNFAFQRINKDGLQVIWDGASWLMEDGYPDFARRGATADRPTLGSGKYIGFRYFDETLGKYVYWDGTQWIDGTGVPAANSLKVLSISQTDYDNLGTYDASTLYVITSV